MPKPTKRLIPVAFWCSIDALKNLDDNCNHWERLGETGEIVVFPQPVGEIEASLKVGLPVNFHGNERATLQFFPLVVSSPRGISFPTVHHYPARM